MRIRAVVTHFARSGATLCAHERAALESVARSIARLKCWDFRESFHPAVHDCDGLFFVPSDTLVEPEAHALGISCPEMLFGGVVPHAFVKTKAITHELVSPTATRPEGWSTTFTDGVREVVLPGYTAFSLQDVQVAARRLLTRGAIRLKQTLAHGGYGQAVVSSVRELEEVLGRLSVESIAINGLVIETNLCPIITRSVGQVAVGDSMIAYHGVQRTVINNAGRSVYGGSSLICVRGGWDALENEPMDMEVRVAVSQARIYDEYAIAYPGFFASRRNYDVAQGLDGSGTWRSGVLEASWRSGGASTAELAALIKFLQEPALQVVNADTIKEFGEAHTTPCGAIIQFQGEDPEEGPMVRYTIVRETRLNLFNLMGKGALAPLRDRNFP
jgi:hypothetical protein